MLRTIKEYEEAKRRITEQEAILAEQKARLRTSAKTDENIELIMEPLVTFMEQLNDEVEQYDKIRSGEPIEINDLENMGLALIAARIAAGMSQSELAKKIGVHVSQVSRDEKNEYHGVTIERAARVLRAIGAKMHGTMLTTGAKNVRSTKDVVLVQGSTGRP
jgi:ribosome-binding protein aMBF1 (putative translation factor)